MTDTPTVRVTLATLGDGEEMIELEPGESISEAMDGPAYLEVEALEVESADDSDDSKTLEFDVADTEYEQEDDSGDREWTVKTTQCTNCGAHYPADRTRCQSCGTPNKNV